MPNLVVLSAGHIPPNPAELLGSAKYRELMHDLRHQFDWIIVDAPPVMAVTDAVVVASGATGVVFVVGAEMTSRRHAAFAIEQLAAVKAHFIGARAEPRRRRAARVLLLDLLPEGLHAGVRYVQRSERERQIRPALPLSPLPFALCPPEGMGRPWFTTKRDRPRTIHGAAPEEYPVKIFVTADPTLPVPPRLYGGIERVIALLVEGLQRRGHSVTLFAHADSDVACDLVPYPRRAAGSYAEGVANAALIARETVARRPDVVQSFSRLAYLLPILPLPIPKVMSYQRQVTPRAVSQAVRLSRGSLSYTGCSRHLIRPVSQIGRWRVIYNAVAIDRFRFSEAAPADGPLVFLGRVEHIKGAHLAIDVARRAGRRLVIAGNIPDGRGASALFPRRDSAVRRWPHRRVSRSGRRCGEERGAVGGVSASHARAVG